MQRSTLFDTLNTVAKQYPTEMYQGEVKDIPRMMFNIGCVLDSQPDTSHEELSICDIGGGVGLFSAACAAYGFKRTVLIDDFDDSINHQQGDSILDLHTSYGVEVVSRDAVAAGLAGIEGEFDAITTFDSMEHWHHSPKQLFQEITQKLKPGGVFVLGVPNCVNIRKRIAVPLGRSKWSSMHEWYQVKKFRGHVREPDVSDLHYIAQDMGLENTKIIGRNWLGYYSDSSVIKALTAIMDYPLRLRPQFCSDIYLIGHKPN